MSHDAAGSSGRNPVSPELVAMVATLEANVAALNEWLKRQRANEEHKGAGDEPQ